MTANERYANYPNHPLHDVPEAVLEVARRSMDGAVEWKDVSANMADPIAESVISALVEAGYWFFRPDDDDHFIAGDDVATTYVPPAGREP